MYKDVPKKDAINAFELFDKEKTGKILIEDFKHIMINLSEGLERDEIEDFLKIANQHDDGYIHYHDFVDLLRG